jgi:ribosomal protein L11 methyltransferase
MAFGTGEHPTTRMCLEWLQGAHLAGRIVVDYGCGSGVLAIAACLHGASAVAAVDADLLAVRATRANLELNACSDRCAVALAGPRSSDEEPLAALAGAAFAAQGADAVLANILKPALLDLRARLVRYTKPGGALVLSGLLQSQVRFAGHQAVPVVERAMQTLGARLLEALAPVCSTPPQQAQVGLMWIA